ncbi:ricin-type beta-trefoil lectin domain protein [Streptomyces sp. NBC_00467]|uniref:ricin-type beta-trefoil lectin domain protein n=1 Tax=Streptomyces sp. NBC_00467 TaxID=2975752 RepID=UPI002E16D978
MPSRYQHDAGYRQVWPRSWPGSDIDYFYICHLDSHGECDGRLLVPDDIAGEDGTPIVLTRMERASEVADVQMWTLTQDGLLVNKGTRGVMQAGGTASGDPVTLERVRNPLRKRQRWYFDRSTGQLRSMRGRNLVLATGGSRTSGPVMLQTAAKPPAGNQRWETTAPEPEGG